MPVLRGVGFVLAFALLPGSAVAADLEFGRLGKVPDEHGFGGPIAGAHGETMIVAGGANFPGAPPWPEGDTPAGKKVWYDRVYWRRPGMTGFEEGPRLPQPLAYAPAVPTDDGLYVLGGETHSEETGNVDTAQVVRLRWDDEAGELRVEPDALPPLPRPCSYHAAGRIGSTLYVTASHPRDEDSRVLDVPVFWSLDLSHPAEERKWVERPVWPGPPRFKMSVAVAKGRLYMIGGSTWYRNAAGEEDTTRFEYFTDGYAFDPETDEWTRIADLPSLAERRTIDTSNYEFDKERKAWVAKEGAEPSDVNALFDEGPRASAAGCAIGDGDRILLFSGSTGRFVSMAVRDRPTFPTEVLAYDIANDSWSVAGDMPTALVTTTVFEWNGGFVIPGGESKPGIRSPDLWFIRPAPSFGIVNWIVLGGYLAGMVAIGVWCATKETTTEDFFLAGRRIPWWAAGLSIFGTQLSAITFMAIPATAYGSNWVRVMLNLVILLVLPIVALCYLPLYRRTGVSTAYEYLERRFNLPVRWVASGLFVLFQIGRMGIVLYLPSIALAAVTGLDVFVCIVLMGVLATIYTVLGGIEAVVWTDVAQVFVLLGGVIVSLFVIANEVGGFGVIVERATADDKLVVAQDLEAVPATDPDDARQPVPGWLRGNVLWIMIVGGFFLQLVPYTSDQTVVQRYLTTPTEAQAARSVWLNFAMTLPTAIVFFGFGTALYVFYAMHGDVPTPAKDDWIVPWFVVHELPVGVAGLVVAGIFAASMSSLDSSMNSIATAVVTDFHARLNPDSPDAARLRLARLLTIVLGVIGTGAAIWVARSEVRYALDLYMMILGFFGGGLGGLFALAVFTRRVNGTGALAGLVAGTAVTAVVRFTTQVNGFLYAAIGLGTCALVGFLVSAMTPNDDRDLTNLTVHTLKRGTSGGS